MDKKGAIDLRGKITAVTVLIIIVVVLFSVFASLVPEAQTAGDKFNVTNRCTDVGCFYNASLTPACRTNASLSEGSDNSTSCADPLGQGIPLGSLFSSSGIVILLIMVFLLITIIGIVLPKVKGKK